jgi:uncharacterized protein
MDNQLLNSIEDAIEDGKTFKCMDLIDNNPQILSANTTFGTWLHIAASHGQLAIMEELVKRGVDINARGGIAGANALHSAVEDSQYEAAKYLLDVGAEMDVAEPERNPLFAAILEDNAKIVQLLIDRGIDTKVKYTGQRMKNMDAIAFAEEHGAEKCLKLLEEAQAK